MAGIGKRDQFLKKLVNDSVTMKLADKHASSLKKGAALSSQNDEYSKRTLEEGAGNTTAAALEEARLLEAESE
jgi:hypothetical protein